MVPFLVTLNPSISYTVQHPLRTQTLFSLPLIFPFSGSLSVFFYLLTPGLIHARLFCFLDQLLGSLRLKLSCYSS
jgi:hypothetical protein